MSNGNFPSSDFRFSRLFLVGVLSFAIGFAATWSSRTFRLNADSALTTADGNQTVLYINSVRTIDELKTDLDSLNFVYEPEELAWASGLLGYRSFRAGRYEITGGIGYRSFLSKLARGQQDPIQVKIIPGHYEQELVTEIPEIFQFTEQDLRTTLNDISFLDSLGIDARDVIAYLHPDTYTMYWTTSPEGLLRRLKSEMEKKFTQELLDEMEARSLSLRQVLTMASIIQGEAIYNDEMPRISGLYWNRIRIGMPLQADPTVSFALGAKRRLFYADYGVDHPYNTYKFQGLPPGPINNPSYKAIEAAVFPERHEYLYMVATPNGRHLFSKTYEDHQRASRQWRQYMRDQSIP